MQARRRGNRGTRASNGSRCCYGQSPSKVMAPDVTDREPATQRWSRGSQSSHCSLTKAFASLNPAAPSRPPPGSIPLSMCSEVAACLLDKGPPIAATPVANDGTWRHSTTLREFRPPFLNGLRRSVNRKVQGSNPCPGANFRIQRRRILLYRRCWITATVQQPDAAADDPDARSRQNPNSR